MSIEKFGALKKCIIIIQSKNNLNPHLVSAMVVKQWKSLNGFFVFYFQQLVTSKTGTVGQRDAPSCFPFA